MLGVVALEITGRVAVWNQIRQIRASGDPITTADLLARRPQIPDGQNGALVLERMLKGVDRSTLAPQQLREVLPVVGDAKLPPPWQPLTAKTRQAVQDYVADHASLLRPLDCLRDLPNGAFRFHHSQEPALPLGHLDLLARLAESKAVQGEMYVTAGNTAEAIDAASVIAYMANAGEDAGGTFGSLFEARVDNMLVVLVERLLADGICSDDALARLESMLTRREASQGLVWDMRCHQVSILEFLTNLDHGKARVDPFEPWTIRLGLSRPMRGWFLLNVAAALDNARGPVEMAKNLEKIPYLEQRPQLVAAELAEFHGFTAMRTPGVDICFDEWVFRTAQLRCARTAIAAERYRLAQGVWPAAIGDLVPRYLSVIPLDPYSREPLRYERTIAKITVSTDPHKRPPKHLPLTVIRQGALGRRMISNDLNSATILDAAMARRPSG